MWEINVWWRIWWWKIKFLVQNEVFRNCGQNGENGVFGVFGVFEVFEEFVFFGVFDGSVVKIKVL